MPTTGTKCHGLRPLQARKKKEGNKKTTERQEKKLHSNTFQKGEKHPTAAETAIRREGGNWIKRRKRKKRRKSLGLE